MTETLKDIVIARSSIGTKLGSIAKQLAPNTPSDAYEEMMEQITNFLDDIIALAQVAPLPAGKARKAFKDAANGFIATNSSRVTKLVEAYSSFLKINGIKRANQSLHELAKLAVFETFLTRAALAGEEAK